MKTEPYPVNNVEQEYLKNELASATSKLVRETVTRC